MLKAFDNALTIAQAHDEVWIGSAHRLGALAQPGDSTAGPLQTRGVTTFLNRTADRIEHHHLAGAVLHLSAA